MLVQAGQGQAGGDTQGLQRLTWSDGVLQSLLKSDRAWFMLPGQCRAIALRWGWAVSSECVTVTGNGYKTQLYGLLLQYCAALTCDANSGRNSRGVAWLHVRCGATWSPQSY